VMTIDSSCLRYDIKVTFTTTKRVVDAP
jgi:hypothetical protein